VRVQRGPGDGVGQTRILFLEALLDLLEDALFVLG
jgi:hypothetical protein